jgi:hypothetical protein
MPTGYHSLHLGLVSDFRAGSLVGMASPIRRHSNLRQSARLLPWLAREPCLALKRSALSVASGKNIGMEAKEQNEVVGAPQQQHRGVEPQEPSIAHSPDGAASAPRAAVAGGNNVQQQGPDNPVRAPSALVAASPLPQAAAPVGYAQPMPATVEDAVAALRAIVTPPPDLSFDADVQAHEHHG